MENNEKVLKETEEAQDLIDWASKSIKELPSKIKQLETLVSRYENKDEDVYPLILEATSHPQLNYFMLDRAIVELKEMIENYKKDLEKARKIIGGYVDKENVRTKVSM